MVSNKIIKPKIGLIDTGFKAFEGTVVSFCSRRMRLLVKKDSGEVIRVALIPFLRISEELGVDMTESDFFKFRRAALGSIKGLKDAGINFPHKISWLFLKRIRVLTDNVEVLHPYSFV